MSEQDKQAVDKAYAACAHKVDEAADELEKWYMSYSDGPTEEAAEELLGTESKWKAMNAAKEEREAHARAVVLKHLFTEIPEMLQISLQVDRVRSAWCGEEKKLARETNCPDLRVKVKTGDIASEGVNMPSDEILGDEMVKGVLRSEGLEPYKDVISGVTTAVGSASGTVAGAVVGYVTGLVANKALDWFVDPAGDIQKILDDQVRITAKAQKRKFREVMMKELDARRKKWERHIRWER